jgi:hypothetical protein
VLSVLARRLLLRLAPCLVQPVRPPKRPSRLALRLWLIALVRPTLLSNLTAKDECPQGSSSSTGYSPCTPCPIGSYAPSPLATSCTQCPAGTTTINTGAVLVSACRSAVLFAAITSQMPVPPANFRPSALSLATSAPWVRTLRLPSRGYVMDAHPSHQRGPLEQIPAISASVRHRSDDA